MPSIVRDEQFVVVQIARTLPKTNNGWVTTTRLDLISASEGLGSRLGDAYIQQNFGVRTDQGARRFVDIGQAPNFGRIYNGTTDDNLAGALVRLLVQTNGGPVVLGTQSFTPFWHGVCRGPISEPDSDPSRIVSGSAGWHCVSIESVLDQIYCDHGYSMNGTSAVRLAYLPAFNKNPDGDRSASTTTINGQSVYAHTYGADGEPWTADNILDYLLAVMAKQSYPGETSATGWTWAVNDPDNCLGYTPGEMNFDGLTLFQAGNSLANQDRGCTWRVTVGTNGTATINIYSVSYYSINIGAASVPASSQTTAIDIRGNPFIGSCQVSENWDAVYDVVVGRGARPWRAITVNLDGGDFQRDWTPTEEADWNLQPGASLTDRVFRQWEMKTTFTGKNYSGTDGLRNYLIADGSGYTGEREYKTGKPFPPALAIELTRLLPAPKSFYNDNPAGSRQEPIIVVGGGSDWKDKSEAWQITISTPEYGPPIIRIDDGKNGTDIEAALVEGSKILVTLGAREADPLTVSYAVPREKRPNATPRTKFINLPDIEHWSVCPGVVKGAKTNGALKTEPSEVVIRDDVEKLKNAVIYTAATMTKPSVSVTWNNRGFLDYFYDSSPGRLVTEFIQGDRTITVHGIISRRSWQLQVEKGEGDNSGEVAYWVTTYQTENMPTSLEAVL